MSIPLRKSQNELSMNSKNISIPESHSFDSYFKFKQPTENLNFQQKMEMGHIRDFMDNNVLLNKRTPIEVFRKFQMDDAYRVQSEQKKLEAFADKQRHLFHNKNISSSSYGIRTTAGYTYKSKCLETILVCYITMITNWIEHFENLLTFSEYFIFETTEGGYLNTGDGYDRMVNSVNKAKKMLLMYMDRLYQWVETTMKLMTKDRPIDEFCSIVEVNTVQCYSKSCAYLNQIFEDYVDYWSYPSIREKHLKTLNLI